MIKDKLIVDKKKFNSRLIVGTGKYKSMAECAKAIKLSGAEIITVAVRRVNISDKKIVLDPAIGFFRKTGKGEFFTKIKTDWVERDLSVIKNLNSIKMNYPILISVSNKSIIGNILEKENPSDRLFGSITAEAISVLNGADLIRTHNVMATRDAITIASKLSK